MNVKVKHKSKKKYKYYITRSVLLENKFILASGILFCILFLLYATIFSPIYYDYLYLPDDWTHLARAKYGSDGIFGKIKLIYFQDTEIINYSWGYQYFLSLLMKVFGTHNYKISFAIVKLLFSLFHNLCLYWCVTRFYGFSLFSLPLTFGGMIWGDLGLLSPSPRIFSQTAFILLLFLLKNLNFRKTLYICILLLFWTQIHIFFVLFFPLVVLYWIFSLFKKTENSSLYLYALPLFFACTLLNPYGPKIYSVFSLLLSYTVKNQISAQELLSPLQLLDLYSKDMISFFAFYSYILIFKWLFLGIVLITGIARRPEWFLSLISFFAPLKGVRFVDLIFYPFLLLLKKYQKHFSIGFLSLGLAINLLILTRQWGYIPEHKILEKFNSYLHKCSGVIVIYTPGLPSAWIEFFWYPNLIPAIDTYSTWIDKRFFSLPPSEKRNLLLRVPANCAFTRKLPKEFRNKKFPYLDDKFEVYEFNGLYLIIMR